MKKLYSLILLFGILFSARAQNQFCNPNGNVIIYSNYDGGVIYIIVDQNIPNLKIGICTYEAVRVNIQGTYASNVTEVRYAGYIGTNDNCNLGVTSTQIIGVANPVDTIIQYPNVTYPDPNGYPQMICAVGCTNSSTGGCNTTDQIAHYFQTVFGGTLYYHHTQYNCWNNWTTLVSQGGNCCLSPLTSVDNVAQDNFLNVSPVPATDEITVSAEFESAGDASIEIVNVLGEVQKTIIKEAVAELNEKISVADLAASIYFVRVRAGEKTIMQKFVVQ